MVSGEGEAVVVVGGNGKRDLAAAPDGWAGVGGQL